MSFKTQEQNMRRLASLLSRNLGYIWGERESGPNGDKKIFLNLGKTFLRALAKDLGLRDVKVMSNAGGIAVSGECYLYGMWEECGLFICLEQPCIGENVLLYRSIRSLKDHKGGHNNFVSRYELESTSYAELLNRLLALKKGSAFYERAA